MLRYCLPALILVSGLLGAPCLALEGQARPDADPKAPVPQASSGNPRVDQILDRLESKGAGIKGLSSKLIYKHVIVDPVEDETTKDGELLFARGEPNSRFLVRFSKLRASGVVRDIGEHFTFDGRWLFERNDKDKTIVKREIARAGEKTDPFKIGKGPFPLPFGQKREDMLRNFRIELADFTLGDPRNTDHLHCVPVPDTELAARYKRVEIFVDRTLELPVRIVTERVEDDSRIEVDFKDVDISAAPAGSRFQMDEPRDYRITVEPLADSPASQPARQAP